MNDLLDLIVFSPDSRQRAHRCDALAGMGFSPRGCEDSNGLFRLFQARRTPLLVMEAELTDLCMAVAGLRAMDTTAGIVAVSTFDSPENRILGLHCGADACFPPDVASAEIAAALQALVRRAVGLDLSEPVAEPPPDDPLQETWRLANKGWTLISPAGRSLGLTTGERDFLTRLVKAPDRKVSRDAFYPDGAEDADGAITRRRFVDVMISRLRRKATANHMTLPIRAVHGWGYMFAADIALELDPREGGEESRPDGQEAWRRDTADAGAPSY